MDKNMEIDEANLEEVNEERTENSSSQGKIKKEIEIKNNQISRMKNLNECPTCFQNVESKHKCNIISELRTKLVELDKILLKVSNKRTNINKR